jgi:hypothetical protein
MNEYDSRRNIPAILSDIIRKAVALQRRTGLDNQNAVCAVANIFSMRPRRVEMWRYGEISDPKPSECQKILQRWWVAREMEANKLRVLAQEIEQELEQERIEQMQFELPLRKTNDKSRKSPDSDTHDALASVARRLDSAARAEATYRQIKNGPRKK